MLCAAPREGSSTQLSSPLLHATGATGSRSGVGRLRPILAEYQARLPLPGSPAIERYLWAAIPKGVPSLEGNPRPGRIVIGVGAPSSRCMVETGCVLPSIPVLAQSGRVQGTPSTQTLRMCRSTRSSIIVTAVALTVCPQMV